MIIEKAVKKKSIIIFYFKRVIGWCEITVKLLEEVLELYRLIALR